MSLIGKEGGTYNFCLCGIIVFHATNGFKDFLTLLRGLT